MARVGRPSPDGWDRTVRRSLVRRICWTLGAVFVGVNALAIIQARAFCRFVDGGSRTPTPDKLRGWEKARVLLTGVRVTRMPVHRSPADFGLSFSSFQIRDGKGPDLAGWRIPARRPRGTVFVFHGYAASRDQTLDAAVQFHQLGFETVLVDFRACGESGGDETGLGETESGDVTRVISTLSASSPFILYGNSMGGAAVLHAIANDRLNPAAVILDAPFDTLINAVTNRFRVMGLPPVPAAWLLLFWGGVREGFNPFAFSPSQDARSVRCPLLVIRGSNDPTVTREEAARVAASGGGEPLVEIPSAIHEPLAATHPLEWLSAVRPFLAGIRTASQPTPR